MIKKKILTKSKISFLFIFLVLFFVQAFISLKYSQSFHFVDEADHLIFASFMNKGYKLYTNLSTNHQPLVYEISSLAQKITKPQNLFGFIQTGRIAVFLYSFLASLFLLLYFGPIMLFFLIFFEITKFFIFGNLLLSESLVVYPLIYVLGITFRHYFSKNRSNKLESFIFGLSNFFIIFNLLPLLPGLIILNFLYIIKTKKLKYYILGFCLPTVILFIFINPIDYFYETVVNNIFYVIPVISKVKTFKDTITLYIFPFLSFFQSQNSIMNLFIMFFTLMLSVNIIFVLFSKNKKQIILWVIFLLTLLSFNNRNLQPSKMFYNGFHLLPWYAAFIFFNLLTFKFYILDKKFKLRFAVFTLFIVLSLILFTNKEMPYFQNINRLEEHNINYYPYSLISRAIQAISQKYDRLAVMPDESLVYWQTNTDLASRQIIYHDWEYSVPALKSQFVYSFQTNPPEFLYINWDRVGTAQYRDWLETIVASQYWQATYKGIAQPLYIKKSKIANITEENWLRWTALSFDKIVL